MSTELYQCSTHQPNLKMQKGNPFQKVYKFLNLFVVYLFERQRGKETEPPSAGSLPKYPRQPGLVQYRARSWKPNRSFPQEQQGAKHLRHPKVRISRKVESREKPGPEPRQLGWDMGIPANNISNAYPLCGFFWSTEKFKIKKCVSIWML